MCYNSEIMIHKLINISLKSDKLETIRSLKENLKIGTGMANTLLNKILSDNCVDMLEIFEWCKTIPMSDVGIVTNEYLWKQYFTGDLLSDIRGNHLPLNPEELKKQEEEKRVLNEKIAKAQEWLDGLNPEAKEHIKVLTSNHIICWGPACG